MPGRMAAILVVAAACAGLAGCEEQRAVRVDPGAGGSWAAVLPSPRVLDLGPGPGPAWADARNNDQLNPRQVGPVLATDEWPDRERPSLRRPVYVRIYRQPEVFIYYRTDRHRDYWRHRR